MNRPGFSLRGAVAGALFATCMAFGTAQALTVPQVGVPIPVSCNPYDKNSTAMCAEECGARGYARGYCAGNGGCRCLGS